MPKCNPRSFLSNPRRRKTTKAKSRHGTDLTIVNPSEFPHRFDPYSISSYSFLGGFEGCSFAFRVSHRPMRSFQRGRGEASLRCARTFIGRMFMAMVAGRVQNFYKFSRLAAALIVPPITRTRGDKEEHMCRTLSGRICPYVLDRVGPAEPDTLGPTSCEKNSGVLGWKWSHRVERHRRQVAHSRFARQSIKQRRVGSVHRRKTCHISGKEFVNHRTRVLTMYAPARDVESYTLGNAVVSYEYKKGEQARKGTIKRILEMS